MPAVYTIASSLYSKNDNLTSGNNNLFCNKRTDTMDTKEQKKDCNSTGQSTAEEVRKTGNKEKFHSMMKERMEGYDPDDEEASYGMLIDDYNRNDEQKKKLTEAINRDPKLASVLSDIVSGRRSAAGTLARHYGKDFFSAEEGTPEYDDIMKGEEERRADAERAAAGKKEYEDNLAKSLPVIEAYCESKGIPTEKFMDDIWEKVVSPIMQGKYTEDLCRTLDNAFSYDRDVADAMNAGEVKGRNTNINKMRNDMKGDGMPSGLGAGKNTETRRRKNVLDLAREA